MTIPEVSVETAEGRARIRKRVINSNRLDEQWPRAYDWCVQALHALDARDAALAEARARVLQLERQVDTLHEAWGGQTLLAEARAAERERCAEEIREVARRFRSKNNENFTTDGMARTMEEMAAHLDRMRDPA